MQLFWREESLRGKYAQSDRQRGMGSRNKSLSMASHHVSPHDAIKFA